jgi:hypothetical protein
VIDVQARTLTDCVTKEASDGDVSERLLILQCLTVQSGSLLPGVRNGPLPISGPQAHILLLNTGEPAYGSLVHRRLPLLQRQMVPTPNHVVRASTDQQRAICM